MQKIAELQARIRLREGLPHLYGWKWYRWARAFFESKNRFCLLTAANQASKSSSQIRKIIHWSTSPELWPRLWATRPDQFWYMYPSSQQATSEFDTKWQQFLPRGEFKSHPKYGWKEKKEQGQIKYILWNTGLRLYFHHYSQKEVNLQTSTVHYIAADEECPESLYNELKTRLTATKGHFSNVFTATIGQDFWRLAMEPEEHEKEVLPDAFKQTVSLYDCLEYEDGTKSHWTLEDIKIIEDSCSTHNEVLKRVYGRFIKDVNGLRCPTFNIKKHVKGAGKIPFDHDIYGAVDVGSGGTNGHPAAIVFIAVNPTRTKGRVFKAWRGDGIVTSAGDILKKYLEMVAEINRPITQQFYDYGSADFGILASGHAFVKADKSIELGSQICSTLFKFGMMTLDESDDEIRKLAIEISTLPKEGPQKKKKDDLWDAFRYCCIGIGWDIENLVLPPDTGESDETDQEKIEESENRWGDRLVINQRFEPTDEDGTQSIESQFEELNDLYGG